MQIREQIIHYKNHCYESKKKKEEILKKDKKKTKNMKNAILSSSILLFVSTPGEMEELGQLSSHVY